MNGVGEILSTTKCSKSANKNDISVTRINTLDIGRIVAATELH
ncbi:Uncharacterised protein [Vibrio cholerae]|nr:Uncharacterised protein [Vibrio cholerae]